MFHCTKEVGPMHAGYSFASDLDVSTCAYHVSGQLAKCRCFGHATLALRKL